jgi:hypothetical protein
MFVKKHGQIVTPLKTLLKKNTFTWNDVVELVWCDLKEPICTTSFFMEMIYFTKTFVLKCDSSREGLGVMLMQEVCQLSFIVE